MAETGNWTPGMMDTALPVEDRDRNLIARRPGHLDLGPIDVRPRCLQHLLGVGLSQLISSTVRASRCVALRSGRVNDLECVGPQCELHRHEQQQHENWDDQHRLDGRRAGSSN